MDFKYMACLPVDCYEGHATCELEGNIPCSTWGFELSSFVAVKTPIHKLLWFTEPIA